MSETDSPILLFDGDCTICNRWVQFVIKNEKQALIKFTSLTEESSQRFLQKKVSGKIHDSIYFYHKDQLLDRSDAAIAILPYLKGKYSWLTFLKIFPRFLRNAVYDLIAKNRHRWNKGNSCSWDSTLQERMVKL